MAEEYFSRLRHAEIGIQRHGAGAYLLRYAQESSWREDDRRVSNGDQVNQVAGRSVLAPRPGHDLLRNKWRDFMHRRQFSAARNKLNLNDRVQVRIVRKRLKVSNEQLSELVRTAGNSITAVRKEAGSRRLLTLP
jgi:hypothetical protein